MLTLFISQPTPPVEATMYSFSSLSKAKFKAFLLAVPTDKMVCPPPGLVCGLTHAEILNGLAETSLKSKSSEATT